MVFISFPLLSIFSFPFLLFLPILLYILFVLLLLSLTPLSARPPLLSSLFTYPSSLRSGLLPVGFRARHRCLFTYSSLHPYSTLAIPSSYHVLNHEAPPSSLDILPDLSDTHCTSLPSVRISFFLVRTFLILSL